MKMELVSVSFAGSITVGVGGIMAVCGSSFGVPITLTGFLLCGVPVTIADMQEEQISKIEKAVRIFFDGVAVAGASTALIAGAARDDVLLLTGVYITDTGVLGRIATGAASAFYQCCHRWQ